MELSFREMIAVSPDDIEFEAEVNIVNHVKELLIYSYWVVEIETCHWILSSAFSAYMEMNI